MKCAIMTVYSKDRQDGIWGPSVHSHYSSACRGYSYEGNDTWFPSHQLALLKGVSSFHQLWLQKLQHNSGPVITAVGLDVDFNPLPEIVAGSIQLNLNGFDLSLGLRDYPSKILHKFTNIIKLPILWLSVGILNITIEQKPFNSERLAFVPI